MRFKLKIVYYWLRFFFTRKLTNRDEIAAFQAKKLQTFAKQVLSKSRFYLPYFNGKEFMWDLVPIMNKTTFMENFDAINTQGITKEAALKVALEAENSRDFHNEIQGITIGLSTGTSGKRGIFLVSEDERAMWVALVMQNVIKPKFLQKQKVAFFLRANSNLYSAVESSLFKFSYFDIFKPINVLLDTLNHYQPGILAGPPSMLVDICLAQKNKKIAIYPQQIISFAEVLHANDKELIENTFQLKITEVYQCTEGFLGSTCQYGTMHLHENFIQFEKEWIDNERFYPIVTDFSRHSQPIVKYRMDDILQIKTSPCACGSALLAIEKIIGRDDDVLIFQGKKVYPDLISRKIAQCTDAFYKYEIVQTANNQLTIGIECDTSNFENICIDFQKTLDALFENYEIYDVQYVFNYNITYIAGNKTRKIKRLIHEN